MQIYDVADLEGPDDWSGPTMHGIGNAVAKLRWIDSAFRWHRNTGAELFLVLAGEVDMHVRSNPDAEVEVAHLRAGSALLIEDGEEHVAYPRGPAKVLVVEQENSD